MKSFSLSCCWCDFKYYTLISRDYRRGRGRQWSGGEAKQGERERRLKKIRGDGSGLSTERRHSDKRGESCGQRSQTKRNNNEIEISGVNRGAGDWLDQIREQGRHTGEDKEEMQWANRINEWSMIWYDMIWYEPVNPKPGMWGKDERVRIIKRGTKRTRQRIANHAKRSEGGVLGLSSLDWPRIGKSWNTKIEYDYELKQAERGKAKQRRIANVNKYSKVVRIE